MLIRKDAGQRLHPQHPMDLKEEEQQQRVLIRNSQGLKQETWRMWDSGRQQKKIYQDGKNDQLSQNW